MFKRKCTRPIYHQVHLSFAPIWGKCGIVFVHLIEKSDPWMCCLVEDVETKWLWSHANDKLGKCSQNAFFPIHILPLLLPAPFFPWIMYKVPQCARQLLISINHYKGVCAVMWMYFLKKSNFLMVHWILSDIILNIQGCTLSGVCQISQQCTFQSSSSQLWDTLFWHIPACLHFCYVFSLFDFSAKTCFGLIPWCAGSSKYSQTVGQEENFPL